MYSFDLAAAIEMYSSCCALEMCNVCSRYCFILHKSRFNRITVNCKILVSLWYFMNYCNIRLYILASFLYFSSSVSISLHVYFMLVSFSLNSIIQYLPLSGISSSDSYLLVTTFTCFIHFWRENVFKIEVGCEETMAPNKRQFLSK